jgi:hypothetical protein
MQFCNSGHVDIRAMAVNRAVAVGADSASREAMTHHVGRSLSLIALVACLTIFGTTPARAQGFVSPFVGYDFGGDSKCLKITTCDDKNLNVGVTLGALGDVFGFEEEFAYAKNFFGQAPDLPTESSVLTLMSNVMFVPNVGPVRPYGTIGIGLIKSHLEFNPSSVFTADNNNFGWNLGGGVLVLFTKHIGLRGDIRYFHSFQSLDVTFLGVNITGEKLDFGRAAVAFVGKF